MAAACGLRWLGVSAPDLAAATAGLLRYVAMGCHGDMHYLERSLSLRAKLSELMPNAQSVICLALDYWPLADDLQASSDQTPFAASWAALDRAAVPYISRYALGRDYHKTLRQRLQRFGERLRETIGGEWVYRPCVDSAPLFEVEIAAQSGHGWRGKHTLLLDRAGSLFFLGELVTTLPPSAFTALAVPAASESHCGRCRRCLDVCPTQAIVAPYRLDARRCISYLTIEHRGAIPLALRPLMGNRVYGCDDCQLVCPWNRFAKLGDPDFVPREGLLTRTVLDWLTDSEATFLDRFSGSPIRRIGFERWSRNLAVALGNALATNQVDVAAARSVLSNRLADASPLVREHLVWALAQAK